MPPRTTPSARSIVAALVLAVVASGCITPATRAQPRIDRDARDDIFYHFMPIAWRDSNNDAYRFGDFGGMTASLDYLQYLGVTAVWMNPIFPSPAYHGYQHGPVDQVNPWFGTKPQFLDFVGAAHTRDMKVFIDLVAYGISQNSIYFQSAYNNPASPYDAWLAFTNAANTTYQGYTFTTWNGSQVGFIHWDLNNANPKNLVTGWCAAWLDPNGDGDPADGIDGYRLDHVWAHYNSGPNGWGYNIDDFWTPWKQALLAVNPHVFTFAEQADWSSHGEDLLPAHDATLTKPLQAAVRDALASESAAPIYSQMEATVAALPAGKTFMGTIGDHDVDRITSVLGGGLTKAKAAAAILMTQPYPPIIYYGDELGMLGTKTGCPGDSTDIGVREPFKWNAVAGPPMSNYWALDLCSTQNAHEADHDGRSVEEQRGVAGSLLEEYRTLITVRKANVALRRGDYYAVPNNASSVWAFTRIHDNQQLLVAINLGGANQQALLNLGSYGIPGGSTTPVSVLNGSQLPAITNANKGAYQLFLPAYGYRILAVQLTPPAPSVAPVDGRNIPADFGQANLVATQNNATGMGDNTAELDQLFGRTEGGKLWLGLTGNYAQNGTGLVLLFDVGPGGQNVLNFHGSQAPPAVVLLDGMTFDAGFSPDQLVYINGYQGTLYVDQYKLLSGSIQKTYRGSGTVNDGDGYLSGGSNPNDMQVAMDNSNTAGVTAQSAAGAATATTGVEMIVALADLGLSPTFSGTIAMSAFLMLPDGTVGNQFLPGLGGGVGNLGQTPNLAFVTGDQYLTLGIFRRGDCNCDATIDFADIDAFVLALSGETAYSAAHPNCRWLDADANCDGIVDFADIDPFVACLSGDCGCP